MNVPSNPKNFASSFGAHGALGLAGVQEAAFSAQAAQLEKLRNELTIAHAVLRYHRTIFESSVSVLTAVSKQKLETAGKSVTLIADSDVVELMSWYQGALSMQKPDGTLVLPVNK